MITGESMPVPKRPGERVVAGTVSTDSAIHVHVEAVGEDTSLAGIQRLVSEAQSSRSHAQVLADRFAAAFEKTRATRLNPPRVSRTGSDVVISLGFAETPALPGLPAVRPPAPRG
jgi:hypothetical protein